MKTKDLRSIAVMVGLGVALFAAGCGENAPCNTDPAQIEALRAEVAAAEQQAEASAAQVAQAEQQKAKIESDAEFQTMAEWQDAFRARLDGAGA